MDVPFVNEPRFQREFRRVNLLGRGTFGEVWCCKRIADGADFAVKVVRYRTGGSVGKSIEQRVVREAKTLMLIEGHQNIVRFHQAWIEPDGLDGDGSPGLWSPPPLCAPPPSPAVRPMRPLVLVPSIEGFISEASCRSEEDFSYDEGSIHSRVVFFETHEDLAETSDVSLKAKVAEAAAAASPMTPTGAGAGRSGGASGEWRAEQRSQRSLPEDRDQSPGGFATLYIQVELCQEETLQGWIAGRNVSVRRAADGREVAHPWEGRTVMDIFSQCVRALVHVHGRSCVHRDVKPSNVLFALGSGNVRLGDFGLAKVVQQNQDSREVDGRSPSPNSPRGSRCTVGTPSYASPEQLAGEQQLGAATDVYALGLVLAELICPVHTQMERAAVLEGLRVHRRVPAASAAALPVLAQIAVSMTEPDPAKRPTAKAILRQVEKARRRARGTGAAERSGAQQSDDGASAHPRQRSSEQDPSRKVVDRSRRRPHSKGKGLVGYQSPSLAAGCLRSRRSRPAKPPVEKGRCGRACVAIVTS